MTEALSGREVRSPGDKTMNENELAMTKAGANSAAKRTEPRAPRSIRFSDSEWSAIETEAAARGMTAAELARHAALSLATRQFPTNPATFPPEIAAQIERIYRGVYLLSTLKRDEIIREGRQEDLERISEAASESQDVIRHEVSTPAIPAS